MDNHEPKPVKTNYNQTIIGVLIVVIAALLISNSASIYYLVFQQSDITANNNVIGGDAKSNQTLNANLEVNNNKNLNTPVVEGNLQEVAWQTPEEINIREFLTDTQIAIIKYELISTNAYNDYTIDEGLPLFLKNYKVERVGQIAVGDLADAPVYDIYFSEQMELGPASTSIYRAIKVTDNSLVVLQKNSDRLTDLNAKLFVINNELALGNLEPPQAIIIPNTSLSLIRGGQVLIGTEQSPDLSNLKPLFKYNDQNYLYKDLTQNCFLARANDGTYRYYYFATKFTNYDQDNLNGYVPKVFDFNLTDGTKNTNDYSLVRGGGCGFVTNCYSYASYIKSLDQLSILGTTQENGNIYILKNNDTKANSEDAQSVYQAMYEEFFPGYDSVNNVTNPKESFPDFLKHNPIIYWQDPFGDFIEYHNAGFAPMAECGKPVIYLYPQTTTDVAVTVAPTGGFKLTEPAYDNGWFVQAQPNGKLYNYSDKKTYPYLFWEGYALNYQRPEQGFVVAKDEVEKFLADKLAAFGLIPQEYNEFIEFWAPKMKTSPYYFVTFMPKAEFDQYAPLTIKPQPDTIIRVFMDYEPLTQPVKVQPQKIEKTERSGFTVVEWGGALHK